MLELNQRRRTRSVDEAVPITGRPVVGTPVGGAVPVRTAVPLRTGVPVAAAAPVAVAPARQGGLLSLPVLGGLCCLGLILFLIATTIILSLIPVYLSQRNVEPSVEESDVVLNAPINSTTPVATGTLNAGQKAVLQDELQQQLNNDPNNLETTVVVQDATAATSKRKRQTAATIIRITVRLFIRRPARFRLRILKILRAFVIDTRIANRLNAAATGSGSGGSGSATATPTTTTTTTITTTTTNSTGNRTRRLVRRSLEDGGAPAGVVYIDAHQVAAVKGDVSSVSFYVDSTCGSATVEFGAFELLSRNTDKNTAELRLVKRSGALKVAPAEKLKPFMTSVTIHLCGRKTGADCQGHQFPVLPHQYIGVRSDSCRLGFAPVAADPLQRVTWEVADDSDPFEQIYDRLTYEPADYTVLHTVHIDAAEAEKSTAVVEQKAGADTGPRVLFVGSFPPRQCGLAKFLEDLTDAYPGPHSVVAIDEDNDEARARTYPEKVIYRLNQTDRESYLKVADMVNSEAFDVLNVQHEYGLYGGMLGEYVIGMLAGVRKPIILTMHTVIPQPLSMMSSLTRALCATSTRVVVMSEMGRRLLIDVYGVDPKKISVVSHGVPDVPFAESTADAKAKLGFNRNTPTMATFGLLHRNKNVALGLDALKTVTETIPNMKYYIIGETHPAIVSQEGESYRHELEAKVTALGLTTNVEFIDKYVSDKELLDYLAATDIYLTPYAREDQYVSGTLSWAVGLGKAVVSTPYMYAKELLADGRGFLVPFQDVVALSDVIVQAVQDDKLRDEARHRAYQHGRYMTWSSVAIHLQAIIRELILDANH